MSHDSPERAPDRRSPAIPAVDPSRKDPPDLGSPDAAPAASTRAIAGDAPAEPSGPQSDGVRQLFDVGILTTSARGTIHPTGAFAARLWCKFQPHARPRRVPNRFDDVSGAIAKCVHESAAVAGQRLHRPTEGTSDALVAALWRCHVIEAAPPRLAPRFARNLVYVGSEPLYLFQPVHLDPPDRGEILTHPEIYAWLRKARILEAAEGAWSLNCRFNHLAVLNAQTLYRAAVNDPDQVTRAFHGLVRDYLGRPDFGSTPEEQRRLAAVMDLLQHLSVLGRSRHLGALYRVGFQFADRGWGNYDPTTLECCPQAEGPA